MNEKTYIHLVHTDCDQIKITCKDIDIGYQILLEFVKNLAERSCCNVCYCVSCDAVSILRKIGEKTKNEEVREKFKIEGKIDEIY